METAVNKLEALFQKTESDLDYIEQKAWVWNTEEPTRWVGSSGKSYKIIIRCEVPIWKHLSAQLDKIATDQQKSVESIQQTITNTLKIVQHLQQQTDSQVQKLPL